VQWTEATRRAYQSTTGIGPEGCECAWCRNFIIAREIAYPPDLKVLASTVGNDPIREVEVWQAGPGQRPGTLLYGGWFYFVGEIVRRHDDESSEVQFSTDRTMLPDAFRERPVVHVSFTCDAPWLLAEAEPK
jgi:hypothetical protein